MEKKVLIELLLDENDDENTLDIVSFVESPAIQKDFMYFKDESKKMIFSIANEEKRIVTGPAIVPNQEIIRLDGEGNPYFVFFSEETVRKSQELFFKQGKTKSTNLEHSVGMDKVTVVESWIVEDPKNDKSNVLGFSDIPKGTWMLSYKVDNDELWEKVKSGEVKGFSIEGIFSKNIIEMNSDEEPKEDYTELFEEVQRILDGEVIPEDDFFEKVSKIFSK